MSAAQARRERIAAIAAELVKLGATPSKAHCLAIAEMAGCHPATARRHLIRATKGEAAPKWGGKREIR